MAGKVRAGDDCDIYVPQVKDVLGRTVDLTGAVLYCSVELDDGTKVTATQTWVDAATGTGRARFTKAQTLLWPPNTDITFDARVVLVDGSLGTVMEGNAIVLAPITPNP